MNFFQRWKYAIQISDNDQFLLAIAKRDEELKTLKASMSQDEIGMASLLEELKIQKDLVEQLTPKIDPMEVYWNDKRPKTEGYTYNARTILNGSRNIAVDPRIFWQMEDSNIPIVKGNTFDEIAFGCLRYVINHITYTPDTNQFKYTEEWLFPWETLSLGKGDCEDGAILIANMLLKSGVPYWRIRINAGDVKGGGHAWCTYLRESDDQWIILDWCYWPSDSLQGLLYHDAENYYSIWFSFNTDYLYVNETYDRTAAK